MPVFQAVTQYGDWSGEVQADRADWRSLTEVFRDSGDLKDGELIVGIRVYLGEVLHQEPTPTIWVQALVAPVRRHEEAQALLEAEEPIQNFREIKVNLALEEFFRCFKRFCIAMERRGLPAVGRDFEGITV